LTNPDDRYYPDLIVYVANVKQLDKHLLLATQLIDLEIPMIFVANMVDMLGSDSDAVDVAELASHLDVPVITLSARKNENVEDLVNTINLWSHNPESITKGKPTYQHSNDDEVAINAVKNILPIKNSYLAKVIAHHSNWLSWITPDKKKDLAIALQGLGFQNIKGQVNETLERYGNIESEIAQVNPKSKQHFDENSNDRIDKVLAHRVLGPLIFFGLMFIVFQAIFSWSSWPMDLIDESMAWLSAQSRNVLPEGWIADLVADGILAGLGGILIFIPQIFILFFLIGILEEVGYMSRVVFMFDGLLRKFGLSGRSIVALISSSACAIPAIMSTRTISNWKERIITIMVSPLISCSARIPVYAVLVGFVVPSGKWGVFNIQGLAFMGLYLLGIIGALASAYVFKKVIKSRHQSSLMIELPTYQQPRWRSVIYNAISKVVSFIVEAGKIIFVISIIIWVGSTFGPSAAMDRAEQLTIAEQQAGNITTDDYDNVLAAKKLEASYIGHLGKAIEPIFRPLGFDWKMSIAVLTSFAAREVFVGTMATIYSLGSTEDELTVRERMAIEINPITGGKRYDIGTALSLLLFYVFAMQCMSTLAVTKQETGSWKWPIIQFVFMTTLAYIAALIAYQVLG
jgi:ferrous iron transport protein B